MNRKYKDREGGNISTDDYKSYIINNKFLNKMLINLEEFRADMYGVEPEEQYLHPVECRTYNKKIA